MRNDVVIAIILRGSGALAWFCLAWFLSQILPAKAFGQVLYVMALATFGAAMLSAGSAQWLLREGVVGPEKLGMAWSGALASFAIRAVIVLPVFVVASAMLSTKILTPWPHLAILATALAGGQGMLNIAAAGLRAKGKLVTALVLSGPVPHLLSICGLFVLEPYVVFNEIAALSVMVVALSVPVLLAFRAMPAVDPQSPAPGMTIRALSFAQIGQVLFQNLDTIVIGSVLGPVEAAIYLVARRLAGLLSLLYDGLRAALAPHIARAYRLEPVPVFIAQAARANLGFLLIGGAAALLLLVLANPVLMIFGISQDEGRAVLIWLIAAQSAPAIFGATGMLMTMTNLEFQRAVTLWVALGPGLFFMTFGASFGSAQLAQVVAVATLLVNAVCAVILLRRHGIFPGLTAVLHRRVRL